MNRKDTDHYKLGRYHASQGLGRYKWQDPYLQSLYDAGYDSTDEEVAVSCNNCGKRVLVERKIIEEYGRLCANCR